MGDPLIVAAIVACATVSAALFFVAAWKPLAARVDRVALGYRHDVDVAGLEIRPETIAYGLLAISVAAWFAAVLLLKPPPLQAVLGLVACAGFVVAAGSAAVRLSAARTVRRFTEQLETNLRTLAGAVRVGLGLRQAIIHLSEVADQPARREFSRVVGLTNVGAELSDALDELASRMPSAEVRMMARVLRVQARTGSDLAGTLDGLADTIRDRRRFGRKLSAMTAQGRASAVVLGLIPLAVGGFLYTTQPSLRAASFSTMIGQLALGLALALDAAAAFALTTMVRIDA